MKKKEQQWLSFYHLSFWQIAWWYNKATLAISFIVTGVLVCVALWLAPSRLGEYVPLFAFVLLFFLGLLVGYPICKAWVWLRLQEHALGKRYSQRSDGALPPAQREWFLTGVGNNVVLLNRHFIAKVVKIFADSEDGLGIAANYYRVNFIDSRGKSRHFTMEHLKEERALFKAWFESVVEAAEGEYAEEPLDT